jgi:NADH:ubiquinone oxidoreductase subunit E
MNIIEVELCMGSSCFARGNAKSLEYLESYIASKNLSDSVHLSGHLCLGTCSEGPNLKIGETLYTQVRPESVVALLEDALSGLQEG